MTMSIFLWEVDNDNIDHRVGDTAELEMNVIELGFPKSVPLEDENKPDSLDTESSGIDQILSTGSEGLTKGLDDSDSGDGGRQKEPKVWAVTGGSDGIADNFSELVPDMALDFPFELDAFQKEKGESVFVAAHTLTGKTVVAEYAFALASKVQYLTLDILSIQKTIVQGTFLGSLTWVFSQGMLVQLNTKTFNILLTEVVNLI
ncbi:unnamed protein product [Lactuca saligna]|uniref:Uncharacterized protein n=1 Tax=Lactuca saligna TaxID=75948 RepID=A0AA35Y7V2_LACSI|nr:unnamed protein product [Lactuca saligna]